jgi:hypothetical protein
MFTPQGPVIEAQSITIGSYLRERMIHDALEGPLSDCEGTDAEGGGDAPAAPQGHTGSGDGPRGDRSTTPAPTCPTRGKKRGLNSAQRRNVARSRPQESGESGGRPVKRVKRVAERRVTEAKGGCLVLPSDMASNRTVANSGWIGRSPQDFPRQAPTREDLVTQRGMEYFPWDGVCVRPPPFLA